MLICVAAWLSMGYFYIQGNDASDEMETALTLALGDDYQNEIREEFHAQLASTPDFEAIKKPFGSIDPAVEVLKDIPFGSHDQALDIYRPRHKIEARPVLFQIHGGAWTEKMGSKNACSAKLADAPIAPFQRRRQREPENRRCSCYAQQVSGPDVIFRVFRIRPIEQVNLLLCLMQKRLLGSTFLMPPVQASAVALNGIAR